MFSYLDLLRIFTYGFTKGTTVILISEDKELSFVDIFTIAFPGLIGFTIPFLSTVTTLLLHDVQIIFEVDLFGKVTISKAALCPVYKVLFSFWKNIEVTGESLEDSVFILSVL